MFDYILAGAALVFLGPVWTLSIGSWAFSGPLSSFMTVIASIIMPVAMIWRRTHPAVSAIAVYLGALLHFAVGIPFLGSDLLIFISLYSVTVYGGTWARRGGLIGALIGCALQGVLFTTQSGGGIRSALAAGLIIGILLTCAVLAAWALGLARRARLERVESLAERAARLEVERDQQAQIATAAERARIAREMHDVVAHSLSVVISQADGGRYAAKADPEAAERALTTIAESGRTALADLRRILGVLREPEGNATLTPQPDEVNLGDLVAHIQQSGLKVSLVTMGTPRALPAAAGLAMYRIVQESLTNALKHAGPDAEATVMVQWQPDEIALAISDNGRGAATPEGTSGGHGLVGMRERATMLSGTLNAGPKPGGGWQVRATIPLPRTGI